jgi:hypothetical protein
VVYLELLSHGLRLRAGDASDYPRGNNSGREERINSYTFLRGKS